MFQRLRAGPGTGRTSPAVAAGSAYHAEATLGHAGASATEKDVGGVTWRCEGDKCIGKAERYSSLDSI
jgi:hypothetical protein